MYGPPSRITERDLELIDEIDQEDDAVDNEADEATMTEDNVNTPMRGRRRRRPSDGAQRRQEQLRRQLEAAAVLILHDVFGGVFRARDVLSWNSPGRCGQTGKSRFSFFGRLFGVFLTHFS